MPQINCTYVTPQALIIPRLGALAPLVHHCLTKLDSLTNLFPVVNLRIDDDTIGNILYSREGFPPWDRVRLRRGSVFLSEYGGL